MEIKRTKKKGKTGKHKTSEDLWTSQDEGEKSRGLLDQILAFTGLKTATKPKKPHACVCLKKQKVDARGRCHASVACSVFFKKVFLILPAERQS